MNNILEVRSIRKNYNTFTLNDVSFDVPKGYVTGFIGPNGAGKTTTLKLILGVINADSGNIKLFDNEKGDIQSDQIGVVMDYPLYADEWSINDVQKAISPFYKNWDKNKFAQYLKQFDLEPKKKVKELSRGMKVKLQISAALCHDAKLLILDEPTSGLDPVARDEICDLLRAFISDEDHSIIFSTHITTDLEKTADFITFILNGNIVFTGAKDDLLQKYARVAGGIDDLNEDQKRHVIGYRQHSAGFEGMTETSNAGKFPSNVLTEEISLDEIIIFMNKGAKINE